MNLRRLLLLAAALCLSPSLWATKYLYSGAPYAFLTNFGAPCGAGPCANFTLGGHISGQFTTLSRLAPNLADQEVFASVTSYSFTDGLNMYSSSDPNSRVYQFALTTDAGGNIIASSLIIDHWETGTSPHSAGDRLGSINVISAGFDAAVNNELCSGVGAGLDGVLDLCLFPGGDASSSEATVGAAGTLSTVQEGTNVAFAGNAAYATSGNTAVLTADRIQNNSLTAASGPLRMELWAFADSFNGVAHQPGHKLAEYDLAAMGVGTGQLAPGSAFTNVNSGTVGLVLPPDGVWHYAMFVTEYTGTAAANDGYIFDAWFNFSGAVTVGPVRGPLQMPAPVMFPAQQVDTQSAPITVTVTNSGGAPVTVSSVNASDLTEFPGTTTCITVIAAGGNCTVTLSFLPAAAGVRSEMVTVTSDGVGSPQAFGVSGTGKMSPATTAVAVEYYYQAWNFYFETAFPAEIAALDGGAFGGVWKRTGQMFSIWPQAVAGSWPTCRFFSTPTAFGGKSSHFYTPFPAECQELQTDPALSSVWQLETPAAFYVALTDASGNCSTAGTVPLYRAYNNGMGGAPNHRYTTDTAVQASMISMGWIAEGNGPNVIFACVPR